MRIGVLIAAAGSGTRLGKGPKAFVDLAGKPLLSYALATVIASQLASEIVLIVPAEFYDEATALKNLSITEHGMTAEHAMTSTTVSVVIGGAERSDSVRAGLAALSAEVDTVLVHDAARVLTPLAVFNRVIEQLKNGAVAAIPAIPLADTIKKIGANNTVGVTVDRSELLAVQTPQGFSREILLRANESGADATDDAGLVEALGLPVKFVAGHALAFKVTHQADFELAEILVAGLSI